MSTKETLAQNLTFSDEKVKKIVEDILFREPSLHDNLAANPDLSEASWLRFYAKGMPVQRANLLCERPLSSAQRLMVIKKEKRTEPVLRMALNNTLSHDEIELLLSSPALKEKLILNLIAQVGDSAPKLHRELALRAKGISKLNWIASGQDVDLESARLLMETYDSWIGKPNYHERNRALLQILERFPSLIDIFAALKSPSGLRTVASGSRFLTTLELQRQATGFNSESESSESNFWPLMALVNNPVVGFDFIDEFLLTIEDHVASSSLDSIKTSIENRRAAGRNKVSLPYSEVEDETALTWLFNRSRPTDGKPLGRPFDLAQLALNPNLGESRRRLAAEQLAIWGIGDALGIFWEPLWDQLLALDPSLIDLKPHSFTESYSLHSRYVEPVIEYNWGHISAHRMPDPYRDSGFWKSLGEYLAHHLASKTEAWETFFALSNNHEGTIGELVDISLAL